MYMNAATFSGANIIDKPAMITTARPDDLPWADLQIHLRHPIVPDRQDQPGPRPSEYRASTPRASNMPTISSTITANSPAGDSTRPDVVAS